MKKLSLHPLTWWIWSFAIGISVARANTPVFALVSVGVVGLIVFLQRDAAPWGKSFNWTLKVALWILIVRTFIGVTIGVPIPGTNIFTLPRVPLPDWMPGIRIGGAVTLERLSSALSEGVIICAACYVNLLIQENARGQCRFASHVPRLLIEAESSYQHHCARAK